MKRFKSIISILLLLVTAVSCVSERRKSPVISEEITLEGLNQNHWSYFSFEAGDIIGTSRFMSEEEDRAWEERTDWDFAICGDYLKTNSGESGVGNGGVIIDTSSHFMTLEEAPAEGYITDKIRIVRF